MENLAVVAGIVLGLAVALAAVWAVRRVGVDGPRRWGGVVLVVLVTVSVPAIPSPVVPVRVERTRYAGPDLLSDAPVELETRRVRWAVPGLSRVREQRRAQAGRLLDEIRRVELVVPWLFLLVVLGVGVATREPSRTGKEGG